MAGRLPGWAARESSSGCRVRLVCARWSSRSSGPARSTRSASSPNAPLRPSYASVASIGSRLDGAPWARWARALSPRCDGRASDPRIASFVPAIGVAWRAAHLSAAVGMRAPPTRSHQAAHGREVLRGTDQLTTLSLYCRAEAPKPQVLHTVHRV
eukprot:scaffold164044_cov31-Tisochrysis_lutea.AAC.1